MVLLTALFVVVISLPFFKQVVLGEPKTEAIEGRRLNVFPVVSWKRFSTIKDFPASFDRYYNDHFGFRAALLRLGSHIGVNYANISLSPDVIIGKSGWLFMRNESNQEAYSAGSVLSDADMEQWRRMLERKQKWLAHKGIKYLLVIPPVKQDVYPEFMPDKYSHVHVKPPGEQLIDYLKAHHSTVDVISLREPLLEAKASGKDRLYFRHDTHWNTLGAFTGYQAIVEHLQQLFPEMKPMDRSDFRMEMEYHQGDLSRMMGVPDYSAENEPTLKQINPPVAVPAPDSKQGLKLTDAGVRMVMETPGTANKRRVVMQHDSFTALLIPLLSEHFSRITYLTLAWGDVSLKSENALADIIRKEKPDIVIEERLARFLFKPPDDKIVLGGVDD